MAHREASRLIASEDIRRAGLLRRLELRLHLFMCRHCRYYARQIGGMGDAARRIWGKETDDGADPAGLEERVLRSARAAVKSKSPSDADSDYRRPRQ